MTSPRPVRLYAPDSYREPLLFTHTELLFPFWGVSAKESMPYVRAAALKHQYRKEDFMLVPDICDADYVVIPYPYERLLAVNPGKVQMIAWQAREAGKPLLIDGAGDIERPINLPHAVITRIGQYRYSVKENEITVPSPSEDLLEAYYGGTLALREKQERPSVGFAGWATLTKAARAKLFLKELPLTLTELFAPTRGAEHKGVLFRARALAALAHTPGIDTRFYARPTYSGHDATVTGARADNRREFVEALYGSDYALCVRGDANSSIRFYEALSLGRIPLFLDTACVLPLEDRIDYRSFCVYVDWRDTRRIGDQLLAFHRSVSPERFREMQEKARAAYTEYLRFDSFSRHMAGMLRERV